MTPWILLSIMKCVGLFEVIIVKVDISDIVKTDGAIIEIELVEKLKSLNFEAGSVTFNSPVRLAGRLMNVSGIISLKGYAETEYEVECYRCLKNLNRNIKVKLEEEFVSTKKDDGEAVYTYDSNLLDLDKVVVDSILLNLPLRQLCNEACKGFCPNCGTNLNEGSCSCKDEKINPQMEKLKDFFKFN